MKTVLREWRKDDAQVLVGIIGNKKVQDNLRDGIPYPYRKEDADIFIKEMITPVSGQIYPFAITVDGELAGSIAVYRRDNIHFRTGELGYYLGERFWGKGVGTEAVKQICSYIFKYTDIIRIFAEPFAENKASCRVLEKAGFQMEGILRCNAVKNGKVMDMKLYALIK